MIESLFSVAEQSQLLDLYQGDQLDIWTAEDIRLTRAYERATQLAIMSALSPEYGMDLPIGAVVLSGFEIIGEGFAVDKKENNPLLHAEVFALRQALRESSPYRPDAVVSTMEPCAQCQDYIANDIRIGTVAHGLSRSKLEVRGLVNQHDETAQARARRLQLPFDVLLLHSDIDNAKNLQLLDYAHRDKATGAMRVDTKGLRLAQQQAYNSK